MFELRKQPQAPVAALEVASVDRLARSLGGISFEPEFRGETPPRAGERRTDFTAFWLAHVPFGIDVETALARFRALEDVESAEPIAILPVAIHLPPDDSLWSESWWHFDAVGRNDLHSLEAWNTTTGDSSILIAIVDTGVLPYHPDLGGSVAGWPGQIWTNSAEAAGVAGVDDDGNGFVDDVHGWDFVDYPGDPGASAGEDWRDEDDDPNDYAGHGTGMAGFAAALTDNGIGVAGAAWQARIMPLRIGFSALAAPFGVVDMTFAAEAILYATRMGANVINCSFETQNTPGLIAAADEAARSGALIVAAAGNSTPFFDLASREDVLAVGSTDMNDVVDPNANVGDYLDVSAPGVAMRTTFVVHPGVDSLGYRQPGYTPSFDGTSQSAAITSGVVALVLAQQKATAAPPLRPRELMFRLCDTADDITASNPGLTGYGQGRLNAARAVTETGVSFAVRAGAHTVGAAAALLALGPTRRCVYAGDDGSLVFLSARGDTIRRVTLPAAPVGSPAAADMGGGFGAGVFVALADGSVAGFDGAGSVLPGWPALVDDPGDPPATGPSLGDVTGDGSLDIVCTTVGGAVYVWSVSGARVAPFPVDAGGSTPVGPATLSDLDGAPGVEIVVGTQSGRIFAFRNDPLAPRVPGWPKVLGSGLMAPLVMRIGKTPSPRIVAAFGTSLRALDAGGATRFTATLAGAAAADPVAGDLDGDGVDEIVLPLAGPNALAVLDSTGAEEPGWPAALPSTATGAALVRAFGPPDAASSALLVPAGERLYAFSPQGARLPSYPKPGKTGASAGIFDLEGGQGPLVLAGSGPDGLVYFYRSPPPFQAPLAAASWLTARGSFARTGSRLYALPPGTVDNRPSPVSDLAVSSVIDTAVTLHWTATGEDGAVGRPVRYELRAAVAPILSDADFDAAPFVHFEPAVADAGGPEAAEFPGLSPGVTYWFALRAEDHEGALSNVSNTISAKTTPGPLPAGCHAAVLSRVQPSVTPVTIDWRTSPGASSQALSIYDLGGRLRRRFALAGTSGSVVWDGVDDRGERARPGVYFVRLARDCAEAGTRIVLLR